MKFSLNDKLIIAKEHVDKGIPLFELQKKYNFHVSSIKYYCTLYKMYSDKAFTDEGRARTYTREIKLKAIDDVLNGVTSRSKGLIQCYQAFFFGE